MARQRRINRPGAYHHITARGVDRCDIFIDDSDRRGFLALLAESRRRFGCSVLAYCLMSNHIHLTLRDNDGTLSNTLHFLNGVYAKRFNLRHQRTGHLFERRFWSSMLDTDSYLTTCVAYVHMNPVEAGMVRAPEGHRWSSYASYLGHRRSPDFLDTTTLMSFYGHDVEALRRHTEGPLRPHHLLLQLRSHNPPPVIGENLVHDQQAVVEESIADRSPTIDEVVAACAAVASVPEARIRQQAQGRRCPARQLASFVANRHAGIPLRVIAAGLDHSSPAAVSAANRRFERTLDDPMIAALLDEVLRMLDLPRT